MTKQFLAERNGAILTSEHGFVYAWAQGSVTGNQICTLAWLQANRRKFSRAGWVFQHRHTCAKETKKGKMPSL